MTRLLPPYSETGIVYAFKCEGFVKLGWSRTVDRRFQQVKSLNPFPVEILAWAEGDEHDEKSLHGALKEFRHRGEWFRYESTVKGVVGHMKDGISIETILDWLYDGSPPERPHDPADDVSDEERAAALQECADALDRMWQDD